MCKIVMPKKSALKKRHVTASTEGESCSSCADFKTNRPGSTPRPRAPLTRLMSASRKRHGHAKHIQNAGVFENKRKAATVSVNVVVGKII